MEHISIASFDEFAKWYLDREVRKGKHSLTISDLQTKIPSKKRD